MHPVGKGYLTIEAFSNLNLCSGLGDNIEGSVHTTLEEYIKVLCPSTIDQTLMGGVLAREEGLICSIQEQGG